MILGFAETATGREGGNQSNAACVSIGGQISLIAGLPLGRSFQRIINRGAFAEIQQRSARRERPEREHRLLPLPFLPNPDEAGPGEIIPHSVAVGRGEDRLTQTRCNRVNKTARELPASHVLCNHDIAEFWRRLETGDRDTSGRKLIGPIPLAGPLKCGDTDNAVSRLFAQKREHLRPVQSGADLLDAANNRAAIHYELSNRSPIVGHKIGKSTGPGI
jgi:hypothetical protein